MKTRHEQEMHARIIAENKGFKLKNKRPKETPESEFLMILKRMSENYNYSQAQSARMKQYHAKKGKGK